MFLETAVALVSLGFIAGFLLGTVLERRRWSAVQRVRRWRESSVRYGPFD